jgi:acetyltransferase-like isoleucine patch superfamily enzyme
MQRMKKWKTAAQHWLRSFLGLHPACTLPAGAFYEAIAHQLMYTPRVFGDRTRLTVGEGVILNDALINTTSGSVVLHDHVFFGHSVSLLTGTHDYRRTNRGRQLAVPETGRDITVQEGAWLGSNVTVLGPCVIGAHSVVAAGSLVLHDVEPRSVYAGCPAKKISSIEFSTS